MFHVTGANGAFTVCNNDGHVLAQLKFDGGRLSCLNIHTQEENLQHCILFLTHNAQVTLSSYTIKEEHLARVLDRMFDHTLVPHTRMHACHATTLKRLREVGVSVLV